MNNEISCETMKKLDAYCEKDVVRRALTSVFSKTNMNDMAFNTSKAKVNQFIFSIDNKTMGATSQNASGRCWLFAATNVLREIVAKKLKFDPAIMAAPLITTIVDSLALLVYFATASLLLHI